MLNELERQPDENARVVDRKNPRNKSRNALSNTSLPFIYCLVWFSYLKLGSYIIYIESFSLSLLVSR